MWRTRETKLGEGDSQRVAFLPPPDHDQEHAKKRDRAAVINPSRLIDHEAFGWIGKISRALADKDQSGKKKDYTEDNEHGMH